MIAPFERPVVPDVNMTRASSVHGRRRPARRRARSSAPTAAPTGPTDPARLGAPVTWTITRSSAGSSSRTIASASRWVSAITRNRDCGRLMTHDRKPPLYARLMGHWTPPAFWMPNQTARFSSWFGMSVETASPGRNPRAIRALRHPVRHGVDLAVAAPRALADAEVVAVRLFLGAPAQDPREHPARGVLPPVPVRPLAHQPRSRPHATRSVAARVKAGHPPADPSGT